jgi:hypothetical protein
MDEQVGVRKSRKAWWVVDGIALAAVIGAAFVTGRLVAGEAVLPAFNRELNINPSPVLPTSEPIAGLYVSQHDNLLTIGTGNVQVHAVFDENGKPAGAFTSTYDGPLLEVVVSPDTALYRDDTEIPDVLSDTVGSSPIQQMVTSIDTLDSLTPNSMITVWGASVGDRINADVILIQIH